MVAQVDWKTPPRPLSEFLSRFSFPKTQQKLQQRFKCNVYHYRSNYAVIVLVSYVIALIRRPTALLGILGLGFGVLCLNDTFATMLRSVCPHVSIHVPYQCIMPHLLVSALGMVTDAVVTFCHA